MKPLVAVLSLFVALLPVSVSAQYPKNVTATNFGGLVVAPQSVVTMPMTNNPIATTRSIHLLTNSPTSLVVMPLPAKFPMTNSSWKTVISGGYGTNYVVTTNIVTDTMSYVTFTNELAAIVGGATTNCGPLATFTMAPGDFLKIDSGDMSFGPIIVKPIGATNAIFEFKDGK